jgi:hypothetical protein
MITPLAVGLAKWLLSSLFGGCVYERTKDFLQKDVYYSLTEKALNETIKNENNLVVWNAIMEKQDLRIRDPLTFDFDEICTLFSGKEVEACQDFSRDLQREYLKQLYELGERDPAVGFLLREIRKPDDFEARMAELEVIYAPFGKVVEAWLKLENLLVQQHLNYDKSEV